MQGLSLSDKLSLINLQYNVCFGVIFASNFQFDATGATIVALNLDTALLVPFVILASFFFCDWFAYNAFSGHFSPTSSVVPISISIWLLGTVVLLTKSHGDTKYWLTSVYAILLGSFYISKILVEKSIEESELRIWVLITSGIIVLCGLVILVMFCFSIIFENFVAPTITNGTQERTRYIPLMHNVYMFMTAGLFIGKLAHTFTVYASLSKPSRKPTLH